MTRCAGSQGTRLRLHGGRHAEPLDAARSVCAVPSALAGERLHQRLGEVEYGPSGGRVKRQPGDDVSALCNAVRPTVRGRMNEPISEEAETIRRMAMSRVRARSSANSVTRSGICYWR